MEACHGSMAGLTTVCFASVLMLAFAASSLVLAVLGAAQILRIKIADGVIKWEQLKFNKQSDAEGQIYGSLFFLLFMGLVVTIGMCKILWFNS